MKAALRMVAMLLLCIGAAAGQSSSARRKIFIDQDVRGPAGTDLQSMLALLQAPQAEVLGISITSGDGWAKAGAQNALRMLELTGHATVPVDVGAEFPFINSREETLEWESKFGVMAYKGAWNESGYHEPDIVPPLRAGPTHLKVVDRHGADLLWDTVRRNPNEVTVWVGGPLTTVAMALRLHPELPQMAKELVLMGAGFNVDKGGNHRINGRREFNWWFDPEAARMVMSANWKKITITPVDISVKTEWTEKLKAEVAKADSKAARYLAEYAGTSGYMWDEIAALAWLDPSIITRQRELWVNVDIDHGPSYGQTIFMEKEVKVPSWFWKSATVQWDLDTSKFYELFVSLMKR